MDVAKKNHGTVKTRVDGSTIMEAYGKDDSDVVGAASKERVGKFGGGMTNLSHSLSGTSANQKGS